MKKYLKRSIFIVLVFIIAMIFMGAAYELIAHRVDYRIFVNGEEKQFDMPIVTIDDRTYIPLREAGEQFGWEVTWDESTKEIHMNANQTDCLDSNEFIAAMEESKEGTLANGRKYKYLAQKDFAMPNEEFIYNEFIEMMDLSKFTYEKFSDYAHILTIEQAAEAGEFYLNDNIYPVDAINYIILYDFKNQVWIITEDVVGKYVTYGGDLIAIRKNGEVIGKFGSSIR